MAKTLKRKEAGSFILRVNGIAVILIFSTMFSGLVTDRGETTFEYHVMLGLASTVFGLFGLTFLLFYILLTGGYIKEGIKMHNLEEALTKRLSGIKARLFPLTLLSITLLIAVPVAGASLLAENNYRYLHFISAIAVAVTYIFTWRSAKKELLKNRSLALEVLEKSGEVEGKI